MPWKECHKMIERCNFIKRLENGERLSDLCKEFGISRKTGYKFLERFKKHGEIGLTDQSKRPQRMAHVTPVEIEELVIALRQEQPTWGAPKLREVILKRHPGIRIPARSTIDEILDRDGLVKRANAPDTKLILLRAGKLPHQTNCGVQTLKGSLG